MSPAVIGLLAAALASIAAGVPSYWGDEAASVLSAQRSIPSLLGLLAHIDAVHGLYYLFLHGWIGLFGTGEFATRAPSAIAIGFAAAGTVVLAERLVGRRAGILAGLVFAVLPVVTRYGIEARSYAFVMAASVWILVLLLALVRRGERRLLPWAAFVFAFAAGIHLFVYLVLLWPVQLALVALLRPGRAIIMRWMAASGVALALASPFIALCLSQRQQIAFLAHRRYAEVDSVVAGQWFGGSLWLAVPAWALMLVAVFAGARDPARRRATAIIVAWAAVPTLALLAGNAWLTPMYNLRYPAFSAPAVAMLIALGLLGIPRMVPLPRASRWMPAVGLAALVAVAVPGFIAQRTAFAKDGGSDLRQLASTILANAAPGDGIVFDATTKPSRRPRLALDLYPSAFAGLDDVALRQSYAQRSRLWDRVAPVGDLTWLRARATGPTLSAAATAGPADSSTAAATSAPPRSAPEHIWVIELGRDTTELEQIGAMGYDVRRAIPVHRTTVYELVEE
ncbi:mannosyltransferase [Agromyces sp. CF514]|nr:mannosyltransferase [Agromyces sp. CF514]